MPRKAPAVATSIRRTALERPRLVPDPKQRPSYSPEVDGEKILAALLARHEAVKTTAVQWAITCTWAFGPHPIWRAEAWHPNIKIMPYTATGFTADEAMERLHEAVLRRS